MDNNMDVGIQNKKNESVEIRGTAEKQHLIRIKVKKRPRKKYFRKPIGLTSITGSTLHRKNMMNRDYNLKIKKEGTFIIGVENEKQDDKTTDSTSCSSGAIGVLKTKKEEEQETKMIETMIDDDFSDVVTALRSLEYRHAAAYCPLEGENESPVALVLKPMLHATFFNGDNTAESYVDVNLELQQEKRLRPLQLHGTTSFSTDIALVETNEYIRGVWSAHSCYQQQQQQQLESNDPQYLLRANILHQNQNRYISLWVKKLKQYWFSPLVSLSQIYQSMNSKIIIDNESKRTDENNENYNHNRKTMTWKDLIAMSEYFIKLQILIPRQIINNNLIVTTTSKGSGDDKMFWFSLPRLGYLSRVITNGRNKVIAMLKRAPQQEIKRLTLDTLSLEKQSSQQLGRRGQNAYPQFVASGAFIVRDLLARNLVKELQTPNGQFIQLQRNKKHHMSLYE